MKKVALLIALLLISASSSAHAANIWAKPRFNGYGGTNIFIAGRIFPGDDEKFLAASANAAPPVFVYPSGPGGAVQPALVIMDTIAKRKYSTVVENGYDCASSCAFIWASGYGSRAIIRNSGRVRFHSCADYSALDKNGTDDMQCNNDIMQHLKSYAFTDLQARWAVLYPHETTLLATKDLATRLGFRWQWINAWLPGWADQCTYRLCIAVP